jgi:hypothetical protein
VIEQHQVSVCRTSGAAQHSGRASPSSPDVALAGGPTSFGAERRVSPARTSGCPQ